MRLSGISWVIIACAAALVGLLAYGVSAREADTSLDDAVAKGERPETPAATLSVLGRERQASVADYRGKVVILNFWASWCKPCIDELPLLERTHRRIAARDGMVLGVNYKDLTEKALGFVRRFELTYPSLRDHGDYAEDFGSRAFPESFVIDRQGRVAAVRRGPVTQRWLDRTLPALLKERT